MSHQTGIKANDDLRQFFADCKDGSIRLIVINIVEEELTLTHREPIKSTWDEDFDALVIPQLKPKEACYILYRLDSHNQLGYEWLYINWVPNNAPVRQKMLYAATRATLKKEFGDSHFKDDITGYIIEDVNLEGYKKHLVSKNAPPPLTMAEEELKDIKKNEIRETGLDEGKETMKGIGFPLTSDATQKMKEFVNEEISYLQLCINITEENIQCSSYKNNLHVDEVKQQFPAEQPRYHLFRFTHVFEGNNLASVVFIYSMPGYKCSIKERMLYSSCKACLINLIESHYKIVLEKKLEIETTEDFNESFLFDALHPQVTVAKSKFEKPSGPGNRGPRRLIKQ